MVLLVNGREVSAAEALVLARWRHPEFADELIEHAVVEAAAEKHGIRITDQDLQRAADAFRREHGLLTRAATAEWLRRTRLSLEEWEGVLEARAREARLREALFAEWVEPHFDAHRSDLDLVRLSRMLLDHEGWAKELRGRIEDEGAEFEALARRHSVERPDPETSSCVRTVRREALEPEIQGAVLQAAPGALVGPVRTAGGWLLARVEAIRPAVLDEDTRELILRRLWRDWLTQERATAEVAGPAHE
jgi:putative peptide maturation system protein